MNISSTQGSYSITSNDTVTIDVGSITQDISFVLPDTITLSSGSYDDTIIVDSSLFSNRWITAVPFENGFPEWNNFQNMRQEYPGLEQAYEKLKTFYVLCKDDWNHKQKGKND